MSLAKNSMEGEPYSFFGRPEWYFGSPAVMRRFFPMAASSSRPAGSLNEPAFDMGILLDAMGVPGFLGRGENPDFLAVHVLADV